MHHRMITSLFSLKVTAVTAEVLGAIATAATALAPDMTLGGQDMMWIWRGVIVMSLLLNLHFLRKVYFKVGRVDTHTAQISTIIIAIEYLAVEAIEHGAGRSTDKLILTLLDNIKRLQPPPEETH